ncbi:MAG: glycosyltransferase family protein [Flavitalea sp.]
MKILYSIQATGNGHISRAMELIPYLEQFGKVDLFLSGSNSTLELKYPVKFRSRGLSLHYTCKGSLDYWKTSRISFSRIMKEVRELPVENYDLILNDFECITSMACKQKRKESINFGHQASFMSDRTPRPQNRSTIGEFVLKNYAKASSYVGLHFDNYDSFIYSPVIKQEIIDVFPQDHGYITVYLPAYCEADLLKVFSKYKDIRFEIFSRESKGRKRIDNIELIPVDSAAFNQSLIYCHGLITGGGFETPAEALYLKKKLIAIPIRGQYEQQCNAAALRGLSATICDSLEDDFDRRFNRWINEPFFGGYKQRQTTMQIIEKVISRKEELVG